MFFMQCNILYLIYIGHLNFYCEPKTKHLEVYNEFTGIVMCYSYLLLCNLVSSREQRHNIGLMLLAGAGLMIGLNLSMMLVGLI